MNYALVDCNNFFVSCERVFRPELEGKAVVVLSNNDGCVVARSNESKAMGIQMGTPFFKVKSLVDAGKLIVCSSNYNLYGDLSSRVMSMLSDAAPSIEIYSIDEAFLDVEGISESLLPSFCSDLRASIRRGVGIPVSIGVAPTKTLAKIASHFAKKYSGYKGVCFINDETKRLKALKLTPIGDVWGIGHRLAPRLEQMQVKTALDFIERPLSWASGHFGVFGERIWNELQGTVAVETEKEEARKSICTSRSFADMTSDFEELSHKVADFAAACAKKLREEGTAALEVTTALYTNRFRDDLGQYYPSAMVCLPMASNSTRDIVGAALKGLRAIFREDYKYKKAGVTVSKISPADALQSSMFDVDYIQREKNEKLSDVTDKLNSLGGDKLLRLAVQDKGHYADGIRREHASRLYSTRLSDIIEVVSG